ncbi:nitrate ABC transporter ATPase [Neosynechococcus sphagnicola sy1]|uniref:Nitrate ABC transporter ATPase n=1 Tax=Neosynechococcus sphagnicola sy1 TaxID=1497020 RepID=A0A098TGB0_9CYAN|nr:ABC transporter ATP-binding protein [Neosynechococcus sphagnicola]KGF71580.1 nitrate ABC transporter ATPase [Neosynechococcus sphagnicola sy1]
MNSHPAIILSHVCKDYANGLRVLEDINLSIQDAQFVSLVGPSGCGKSTLLRIIAGLGRLTTGQLCWGTQTAPRKLAFVFQDAALMPWATVQDNVGLPLKLARTSKSVATAAVAEALAMVDLQGFEQCYPQQLSGGMKMRVSIARAMVTKPEILLMDEPFGALDEITRSKLNTELLGLWTQKQWTVVFVTHNLYEAIYLSNRVVVMAAHPGRIVADVAIEVPYPRPPEFRASTVYSAYCRTIAQYLAAGTAQP